jgi:hypothetical protein
LFVSFAIIFRVFRPKIACQVQKPPKSHKQNKIGPSFIPRTAERRNHSAIAFN